MSTLPLPPVLTPEAACEGPSSRFSGVLAWSRGRLSQEKSWAVADQVVYSAGNMLVAALISRGCSRVVFGEYILTQRALDILIQLSNVFLWGPYTFRLPGVKAGDLKPYLGSIVAMQAAFCIAFALILALLQQGFRLAGNPALEATFGALVFSASGILFREFTRRIYFAQLRFRTAFFAELATVSLQVAFLFALGRSHRLSLSAALIWLSVGAVLVCLWWLVREWNGWTVRPTRMARDFSEDLQLGRWFFGSNAIYTVSTQWNPWMLNALLGSATVANYAIVESLVNIPRVALTSMQNVMGPQIARAFQRDGTAGVARAVTAMNRLLFVAALGFLLFLTAVSPFAAHLIYKQVPPGIRALTFLLGVNLLLYAATLAQSYGLTALGRADLTVWANALGLFVQVAVCLLLIRHFSIATAAVCLIAGTTTVLLTRQVSYSREVA